MPTGTVKLFQKEKGYGYIAPDTGEPDLFFDSSNVETPNHEVVEGQRVEYEKVLSRKGPAAVKIKSVS